MTKLSIKLGILFFFLFFGLTTCMFFILHEGIVKSSVEEELKGLQSRGNAHRAVLEKSFNKETLSHVVLMESESTTNIVVLDQNNNVLGATQEIQTLNNYLQNTYVPREGKVVEANWNDEPYIVTISPVQQNNETIAYVYMFQDTESIHSLIHTLNRHFLITGVVSVFLTIIIIIFLTRAITKPLLQMKKATAQMSKGNFSISLPQTSNDELGDLATSIQSLADELSYLTKERNEFLASIAHELRTPLTYIKGYADILQKHKLTEAEEKQYLSTIVNESNHLTSLIKKLFDLAKMDQHSFELSIEKIHLHSFLQQIEQKYLPIMQQKKISFSVICDKHIYLDVDSLMLERIISNLLDNAMNHSQTATNIQLAGRNQKGKILLTITDNGKGIPEKDLPFIFNRLYRVDKSRTRTLGGSGLGLAIVKELVHAHHGEIVVTSNAHLTVFTIIFEERE